MYPGSHTWKTITEQKQPQPVALKLGECTKKIPGVKKKLTTSHQTMGQKKINPGRQLMWP